MENKINIAEILKDCPKGTKLYSTIFGEVVLRDVNIDKEYPIKIVTCKTDTIPFERSFTEEGHYMESCPNSECVLFPSRKMRDWTKFFKRGDVVWNKDMYAIFEGWANDDYTKFNTTINFYVAYASFGMEEVCDTDRFVKARDEERATFIDNVENYYNGKYNPETLQVETVKSECPIKPFDKVLVRDDENNIWYANYFSHYREDEDYPYACMDSSYRYCIPYEGNEHLLGTTDTYTEGGSE